ncbi:MAG: glycosyltransferase family 4 protein [Gemmatimonadota bacterium]
MRILLSTDIVGGVWRYTVTLVKELVERGHACAVAVLGAPDSERLAQLPPEVDVLNRDLRLEWMAGGLEDAAAGTAWLEGVAGSWRPDIVHLNQFAHATGSYPAPVVIVAHSDVVSWYSEVRGTKAPEEWRGYADVVRAGLHRADVVVAPTAYQSGLLARHYGRSAVRVIHNGTELPAEAPELPASERSMVLVAGRAWDEAKGVPLLDQAVAELGERAPSVHLVGPLAGPGGESVSVTDLVTHGEVEGPVMKRFYANTRLYVGPSLYEPFGLSPLEAAGHGCPLLLSGIGSFRELWTDAAEFFDPLYPDVLATRLLAVLDDPARLDEIAEVGRARARERYTAARMADRYETLYRQLAGKESHANSVGAT